MGFVPLSTVLGHTVNISVITVLMCVFLMLRERVDCKYIPARAKMRRKHNNLMTFLTARGSLGLGIRLTMIHAVSSLTVCARRGHKLPIRV